MEVSSLLRADDVDTAEERCEIADAVDGRHWGTGSVCSSSNRYILREKIGEGGMGLVYRAYDEKLRRDVALKVLRKDDEESLERFVREQEITACLDHPNFVRVLSVGYVSLGDGTRPYYTMPLIRGQTLERLILRRKSRDAEGERLRREYSLATLLRMLGDLCLTLQSAHDKRIIHRDLKPSNVLIGPYGDIYVTDLGMAKFMTPMPGETTRFDYHVLQQLIKARRRDLSREDIMGTPYYMAPEQALAPSKVDARADIFGLGGVMYFILTGRKPHYREAAIQSDGLRARLTEIEEGLRPFAPPSKGIPDLLALSREAIPEPARPLIEEFREILGLLNGSEFYRLRLTMRECLITRPSELLASADGDGQDPSVPSDPIDPILEFICMKALARNRNDRFSDCRQFWQVLHNYVENAGRAA